MKRPIIPTLAYYSPLLIIFVSSLLLCLWNPLYDESESWYGAMEAFRSHPSLSEFFRAYGERISYTFNNDNIRIAQLFVPALYAFPLWVPAGCAALIITAMYAAVGKLVCGRHHNWAAFATAAAGLCLLLPWGDHMFTVAYVFNYPLPTILLAYTLYRWLNTGKTLNGVTAFLLGFVTAWGHEMFGAMLIGAIVVTALFFNQLRNKEALLIIIGAIAFIIIAMNVPGTGVRHDRTTYSSYIFIFLFLNPHMLAAVFLILVGAITLSIKRLRHRFWNPVLCAAICIGLCGCLVAIVYGGSPRVNWGMWLGVAVTLGVLTASLLPGRASGASIGFAAAVWLILVVHLFMAVRLAHQYYSLIALGTPDRKVVFTDYPEVSATTLLATLKKVDRTNALRYLAYRHVYPSTLQGFTVAKARPVATDSPDFTAYDFNGHLLIKGDLPEYSYSFPVIDITDLGLKSRDYETVSAFTFHAFDTAEGRFFYVSAQHPERLMVVLHGQPIESIQFQLPTLD